LVAQILLVVLVLLQVEFAALQFVQVAPLFLLAQL
jgi:hypothetical protein